ncbi:hypothetical protein ZWY2020_019462 [Hordeum vulgare]|nr:hypothetical protein ZWY2020_019462 [Hordeum vulgare]
MAGGGHGGVVRPCGCKAACWSCLLHALGLALEDARCLPFRTTIAASPTSPGLAVANAGRLLRLTSVWFGFFNIRAPRSLPSPADRQWPRLLSLALTEIHGRTIGVWTLLTCTPCFLCAFNLESKPLYIATFLSFIYALGHFLTEYLIYHTIAAANLSTVGFFAGTSLRLRHRRRPLSILFILPWSGFESYSNSHLTMQSRTPSLLIYFELLQKLVKACILLKFPLSAFDLSP